MTPLLNLFGGTDWVFIFFFIILPSVLILLLIIRLTSSTINSINKNKRNTIAPISVTEELEKLFSLKEKGIITREEFEESKSKLLKR